MPDRMRYGRTPDTVCMLGAVFLASGTLTVTGILPGSVDSLVPLWVGFLWSSVYCLSAGLALVGVLRRDELTGWGLELTGRIPFAITGGTYFAVLYGSMSSWGTAIVLAMIGALAVSSACRVWQLVRRLDAFRAKLIDARRGRGGRQ